MNREDEEFILVKKRAAASRVESSGLALIDGEPYTSARVRMFMSRAPPEVVEYHVWDGLATEFYFRAIERFDYLQPDRIPADDLQQLVDIAVRQSFEGKNIAGSFPVYDYPFTLAKHSVLGEHVTAEHKRRALNEGLWRAMHAIVTPAPEDRPALVQHACEGLDKLLRIDERDQFYDYDAGVARAAALPEEITLSHDVLSYHPTPMVFMQWYRKQRERIEEALGEHAPPVIARIAAPMAYFIINVEPYSRSETMASQSRELTQGILKQPPIQNAISLVFKAQAVQGFEDSGYFHPTEFDRLARVLDDPEGHAAAAWRSLGESADLDRVHEHVWRFVPQESIDARKQELQERIRALEGIDTRLYAQWKRLEGRIPAEEFNAGQERMLARYAQQEKRPAKDDLLALMHNPMPAQYRAVLFCDLLRKRQWDSANNMLHHILRGEESVRRDFVKGAARYVRKHKPLPKEASTKQFRRGENLLQQFYHEHAELFE